MPGSPFNVDTALMRLTLDIDDELMASLMRLYPDLTKRAAVETAIRSHLREEAIRIARSWAGKFPDEEDISRELRRSNRHT